MQSQDLSPAVGQNVVPANVAFAVPTRVKTASLNRLRATTLAVAMVAGGALMVSKPHVAHAVAGNVVSISDVSMREGDNGTTAFIFVVTRTGDLSQPLRGNYSTADDSATATSGDYGSESYYYYFPVGQDTTYLPIYINGDTQIESDENFTLQLSDPSMGDATFSKRVGVGTIINDDFTPTITGTNQTKARPGDQVVINGTGFTDDSRVRFNGSNTDAAIYFLASNQIGVIVPQGAKTGAITVTTLNGTATSPQSFGVIEDQSLIVNTVNDTLNDTDGVTSLREAINFANADGANSPITFAPNVFGLAPQSINLSGGELAVANDNAVSITAPAVGLTINASDSSRIFNIAQNADATLTGLTITRGGNTPNGGSGILNNGILSLNNSTVIRNATNNSGGGIYNSNSGTLMLTNSTVNGNSAVRGGGIYNLGAATILNSTIDGNSASNSGGGIYSTSTLNVTSATISRNTSGNGGAFYNVAAARNTFKDTLFAENGGTPFFGFTDPTAKGDANFNYSFATSDAAGLAGLADNGGTTRTAALLPGSPAIDGGDPNFSGAQFDQRGADFKRVRRDGVDVGAFEVQNDRPTVSDFSVDVKEDEFLTFSTSDFDGAFTDPEAAPLQSVSIDSLPTNGVLQLNGTDVTVGQVIQRSDFGNLTYVPAADSNGADTFKFNGSDAYGPALKGAVATINVAPVNDAPSFNLVGDDTETGPDQTVLEDAGAQTVAKFATNISAGPSNESDQKLTFTVEPASIFTIKSRADGPDPSADLFSVAPAIDANGTLTYTPAPNANGTATFQVTLMDDGGTDNGGQDTSRIRFFSITMTPVNDAPTFDILGDQSANLNDGAQKVANFITNKSAGPADESGQNLTTTVTNDNNALFSSQPTITSNGNLLYTPAPGKFGTATVSVTVKDDGGTDNGGVDTTVKTFVINVKDTTINFSVTLQPRLVFTNDTVTATPSNGSAKGVQFLYEYFVNNVRVQRGSRGTGNTLDLRQRGFGDKGDVIKVVVTATNTNGVGTGQATNSVLVRNSAPVATGGTGTAKSGTESLIELNAKGAPGASDIDGDLFVYRLAGKLANGSAFFETHPDGSGVLHYTPKAGFVGTEDIKFYAVDGDGAFSNAATIRVTVSANGASSASAIQSGSAPSGGSS